MALNSASQVFIPQPVLSLDEIIRQILVSEVDYYVKGGKAFNYYYAMDPVPTVDWDIVAFPYTSISIGSKLSELSMKKLEWNGEIFLATSFTQSMETFLDNDQTYSTVVTYHINDHPIMDIILTDDIQDQDIEIGTDGIRYLIKPLLMMDVRRTLDARIELSKTPSKKSKTRRKRSEKLLRNKQRMERIDKYKGKRRSVKGKKRMDY